MILCRTFDAPFDSLPPCLEQGACVCVGNFDGVHRGHQALLAQARQRARQDGGGVVAVTFDPHPLEVLTGRPPARLLDTDRRASLLEAAGADLVLVLTFTSDLARLPAELFVRRVLLQRLAMRRLFLGRDFALGRNREGTPETLARLGAALGFTVEGPEPVRESGEVVSSSRIRELVAAGEVRRAAALLGRPHTARGVIVHGRRRGTGLGFPTANLSLPATLLPRPGVYATLAALPASPDDLSVPPDPQGMFPAVTSVGSNPTFGPAGLSVETHIFDLCRDLYGRPLEIAFMERLRDEKTFSGPQALIAQIRADAAQARTLTTQRGGPVPSVSSLS